MNRKLLSAIFLFSISLSSYGAIVIASADSNIGQNDNFFINVFGGKDVYARYGTTDLSATTNWASGPNFSPYVNSINYGSSLTAVDLIGVEWVIAGSSTLWTTVELDLLSNFHISGGNIFVVGEYGVADDVNESGNQVLEALGSEMRFELGLGAVGAIGTAFNTVYPDILTQNVTHWNGNGPGNINGGTLLVSHISDRRVLAYENTAIPIPGAILLYISSLSVFLRGLTLCRPYRNST